MYHYKIFVEPLPYLREIYSVSRNTTWTCSDKSNILVFVESGQCYFEINAERILLKQGNFIFVPANSMYTRSPFENSVCKMHYIHFSTHDQVQQTGEEILDSTELFDGTARFIYLNRTMDCSDEYDKFLKLMKDLKQLERANIESYSNIKTSFALCHLLLTLSEHQLSKINLSKLRVDNALPHYLLSAMSYVQKNYRKKITTQHLATIAGISQQHLIRIFRKHLNTTPIEYINQIKISHAINLLRENNMSVKEISYELGYENPNYFSRLFKKHEGMTPMQKKHTILNFSKINNNSTSNNTSSNR